MITFIMKILKLIKGLKKSFNLILKNSFKKELKEYKNYLKRFKFFNIY